MNVIELHRPSAHVAEVWLNRPEVRNAFNEELIAALTQTFAALSAATTTSHTAASPIPPA